MSSRRANVRFLWGLSFRISLLLRKDIEIPFQICYTILRTRGLTSFRRLLMRSATYNELHEQRQSAKLEVSLSRLPAFVREYAEGRKRKLSINTLASYVHDYLAFFEYFCKECEGSPFYGLEPSEVCLADLAKLSVRDLSAYFAVLRDLEHNLSNRTIDRRIGAVKSLYRYFERTGDLTSNPAALVENSKSVSRPINYMEPNEVVQMLDATDAEKRKSSFEKKYAEHTELRDQAILITFLGTGLRVSELVGLDLEDVNFTDSCLRVVRKGGDIQRVFFGSEVRDILKAYIMERIQVAAKEGHENALFLSLQKKRINVRSVEILVKKYSKDIPKDVHAHTLRATYGTQLYRETNNLLLVAKALNHSSTDVTSKHYANLTEEELRAARNVVKILKD